MNNNFLDGFLKDDGIDKYLNFLDDDIWLKWVSIWFLFTITNHVVLKIASLTINTFNSTVIIIFCNFWRKKTFYNLKNWCVFKIFKKKICENLPHFTFNNHVKLFDSKFWKSFKIKVKVFSLCGNDTKGGEAGNLIEIWQKMMENWRLQSVKSWFQVSKEIQ